MGGFFASRFRALRAALLECLRARALQRTMAHGRDGSNNAGASLAELNDHESALAYLEQGAAITRAWELAAKSGHLPHQTANSSRELGRLDAAAGFLCRSEEGVDAARGGRLFAIVLQYHGDLAYARGDAVGALDWYRQFEARAHVLKSPDLISHALRGRAQALSKLGDRAGARRDCTCRLEVAREMGDMPRQITLLAHWRRSRTIRRKACAMRKTAFETAVAVARDVKGYAVPGEYLPSWPPFTRETGTTSAPIRWRWRRPMSRLQVKSNVRRTRCSLCKCAMPPSAPRWKPSSSGAWRRPKRNVPGRWKTPTTRWRAWVLSVRKSPPRWKSKR